MDGEKIEKYKNELNAERAKLLAELEKENQPVDFGSDIDHNDEEANEAEELGNQLSLGQSTKDRISDIDRALGKIEKGEYGICESCKTEIEEKVLNVSPESRFCSHCKPKNK